MTDELVDWMLEHGKGGAAGVEEAEALREFNESEVDYALRQGTIYESGGMLFVTEEERANPQPSTSDDPPTWEDILDPPFVTAILGRRGSGKSALGHRLLEVFGDNGREAYILGFPRGKRELLPDWLEWLPSTIPFEHWPEESITLVNEAHHVAHARRSMQAENLELDRLVTISRQRDADIVFDTQYARRLDITGVMGVNALIFRYPSLMAEDFERRQMRSLVTEARESLDRFVDVTETDDYVLRDESDELLRRAYVVGEKFRGLYPHAIELPAHWSEAISKAYGGDDPTGSMADVEDVTVKSVEEVADEIEAAGVELEAAEEPAGDGEVSEAEVETGRTFIERMLESDNRVLGNPFGEPIVEIVAPADMEEEIDALVDKWDINPQGPGAIPQPPSFADERPEIAEGLVAWQFLLSDAEDLSSSGFDLRTILDELEDEPVIATASPLAPSRLWR